MRLEPHASSVLQTHLHHDNYKPVLFLYPTPLCLFMAGLTRRDDCPRKTACGSVGFFYGELRSP